MIDILQIGFKMKKLIMLIITITLFSLASCGGNSPRESEAVKQEYTITVLNKTDGGVVTADKSKVFSGEDVCLMITSESGWYLDGLLINGEQKVSEVNGSSYKIENISKRTLIEAEFSKGVVYVSENEKPTVDGEIDQVWYNSAKFNTAFHISEGNNMQGPLYKDSEIRVMWNETGLYFLARVYDMTVMAYDRCNFWVSEVYSNKTQPYSSKAEDGNYAMCINPDGQNICYTNLDISNYWTVGTTQTVDGYIVEVFVPVLGKNPLVVGGQIGFDVSVDYYSGSSERDIYSYCFGLGCYWENVGALKALTLIAQ